MYTNILPSLKTEKGREKEILIKFMFIKFSILEGKRHKQKDYHVHKSRVTIVL